MQITQFVIDLFAVYFASTSSTSHFHLMGAWPYTCISIGYSYFATTYFPNMPTFGSCAGTEGAASFGCILLTSYLLLFIDFYVRTYKPSTKAVRGGKGSKVVLEKEPRRANGNSVVIRYGNATLSGHYAHLTRFISLNVFAVIRMSRGPGHLDHTVFFLHRGRVVRGQSLLCDQRYYSCCWCWFWSSCYSNSAARWRNALRVLYPLRTCYSCLICTFTGFGMKWLAWQTKRAYEANDQHHCLSYKWMSELIWQMDVKIHAWFDFIDRYCVELVVRLWNVPIALFVVWHCKCSPPCIELY